MHYPCDAETILDKQIAVVLHPYLAFDTPYVA